MVSPAESYVIRVNQFLTAALAPKPWHLTNEWHQLLRPSTQERQGQESVLHLGCREAVEQRNEGALDSWATTLAVLQQEFDKKVIPDGGFTAWQGRMARCLVATARLALTAKRFSLQGLSIYKEAERNQIVASICQNVVTLAWEALCHWQARTVDEPSSLSLTSLGEKFRGGQTWFSTPETLIDSVYTLLQLADSSVAIAPIHDLARTFLNGRRLPVFTDDNVPIARTYRCSVLYAKKQPSREKGERKMGEKGGVATLLLELIKGGHQALYRNPSTFAFVRCDDTFLAALDDARAYILGVLGGWNADWDVRWSLSFRQDEVASLRGRSLGAAFADTLWHLLTHTPGDLGIAVSADITKEGQLLPVTDESLEVKLQAVRNFADPKIHTVVVARQQEIPGGTYEDLITRADVIADPERHGHRHEN